MHVVSTLLPVLGLFAHLSTAAYILQDDYTTSNSFFDKFEFFTEQDPTNGFVQYVDQATAKSNGLIKANGKSVYIGVDHTNKAGSSGRQSVRLTSRQTYNHGLVILDLARMPGSACGTWPAFWMLGPDWPNNGEIDIIEGVNLQSKNQITLHTNAGCSIQKSGFSGKARTTNCDVQARGQVKNQGCTIEDDDKTLGSGFNDNQGGIYATEWTSESINVWFFPRHTEPQDIHGDSPNPSVWKQQPTAKFAGNCNIDSHFRNHNIVFDITFCGDWASGAWNTTASCAKKADTCDEFVANQPNAFADSYWKINSLKAYTMNGAKASVGASIGASLGLGPNPSATVQAGFSVGKGSGSPQSTPLPQPTGNAQQNAPWGQPAPSNNAWGQPQTTAQAAQNNAWASKPQQNGKYDNGQWHSGKYDNGKWYSGKYDSGQYTPNPAQASQAPNPAWKRR
ncbi:hypothetical protein N7492_002387 [Penicillium capsulatum]|uniref:endo-1,3(4)-beta-glucanase n=1 Tax=Penicillium capsulatum TaxID=69766 RepID=A0A9W9IJZ6_9EURO|nr:hypothetical protein N7492_002387 [Penicillium capsulatum]KAJ6123008.1 hypothetical protein N7512_005473 [Penicillium capsulatum]